MAKTLLLADDSVTIQKVVGITFANEDVELVTVDNGDDALVRARQLKPDLVLADIGMPGLDGYALCAAIRKEPSIAHTPVLLLTGTFETYDDERAREVGANGYISKPFEAQALVDRVFAMLAQSAAAPTPAATRSAPPQPEPVRAQPVASPIPRPAAPAPARASAPPAPPRLELPPVPGASSVRPTRAATPRATAPFEFEVTPEERPAPAVAAEPLWEAEPELEAGDDSPARRAMLEAEPAPVLEPEFDPSDPPTDVTRLFAPDLLGRAARLPEIADRPDSTRAPRADFSFEDLDFEEPTGSPANESQIFGESSDSFGAETVLAAPLTSPPSRSDFERELEAPLADPLYSQTRFLDPHTNDDSAPSFGAPSAAAVPELPDLLSSDEVTEPSHALDELELSEIEPELEALPLDEADALDMPDFAMPSAPELEAPRALATTRLMAPEAPLEDLEAGLDLDADLLEAEPVAADAELEPELEPLPLPSRAPREQPTRWREPDPRPVPAFVAPALSPARTLTTGPVIDSALLSQTLEKVAWEAFGSLSEQVVNEVRKRVEAVVWEVVPQLCERLIREEIARLKADLPE